MAFFCSIGVSDKGAQTLSKYCNMRNTGMCKIRNKADWIRGIYMYILYIYISHGSSIYLLKWRLSPPYYKQLRCGQMGLRVIGFGHIKSHQISTKPELYNK